MCICLCLLSFHVDFIRIPVKYFPVWIFHFRKQDCWAGSVLENVKGFSLDVTWLINQDASFEPRLFWALRGTVQIIITINAPKCIVSHSRYRVSKEGILFTVYRADDLTQIQRSKMVLRNVKAVSFTSVLFLQNVSLCPICFVQLMNSAQSLLDEIVYCYTSELASSARLAR